MSSYFWKSAPCLRCDVDVCKTYIYVATLECNRSRNQTFLQWMICDVPGNELSSVFNPYLSNSCRTVVPWYVLTSEQKRGHNRWKKLNFVLMCQDGESAKREQCRDWIFPRGDFDLCSYIEMYGLRVVSKAAFPIERYASVEHACIDFMRWKRFLIARQFLQNKNVVHEKKKSAARRLQPSDVPEETDKANEEEHGASPEEQESVRADVFLRKTDLSTIDSS